VKSELRPEYVMANPARVDAKFNTAGAEAGTGDGGFDKCFPPTPRETMKVTSTGNHAMRSYL
jgi:hypothetical protein